MTIQPHHACLTGNCLLPVETIVTVLKGMKWSLDFRELNGGRENMLPYISLSLSPSLSLSLSLLPPSIPLLVSPPFFHHLRKATFNVF